MRKAASLMRHRADAASPGPWFAATGAGKVPVVGTTPKAGMGGKAVAVTGAPGELGSADAQHVAGMDPTVAVALADWLEYTARAATARGTHQAMGLAVARAYLGELP